METASTSEMKTSIVIPKAILHDHPYFSFSEVPEQGDHEYGGHCIVQFTNFNKSAQFGDGMSPNMMITSVPPASIFEGDSDPDSSDDPHQNLVQLTKADLTRASQMQRDPSLRTSRRENKGKTSKYKDEEVDLFNNRRKTPQKKTGAAVITKEKVQPKTPKLPSVLPQETNKSPKKGQNKGKKSNTNAAEQSVNEESTVIEEDMPVESVPLIEEAKRNGEQEKETPKTKSKSTPKRNRKTSNKASNEKDTTTASSPVPVAAEEKNGALPGKVDNVEEREPKVSPVKSKSPSSAKRSRGRPRKGGAVDEMDEQADEKQEEKKDEPPAKKRKGSTKKAEEEENRTKSEKQEKATTSARGKRGATAAVETTANQEEIPGHKVRRNNNQAIGTLAIVKSSKSTRSSRSAPTESVTSETELTPAKKQKQTSQKSQDKKANAVPKSKKKKIKEEVDKVPPPPPIMFVPCDVAAAAGDPWGKAVPLELLTKIFNLVRREMGLLPFVSRISKVCKLWYEATKHPNLWHDVDLSNDNIKKYKKSFHWLCKNRLQQTNALNLSGWEGLRQNDIQILANNAKALESLDLSGCNKLGFESLQTLLDKLDKLHSISLARTWTQLVQSKSLIYLTEKKGAQLKKLDLSENSLVKFEASLRSIMKHCPNLEHLNLNNCMFSTQMLNLQLTKLQTSCPKLKVLLIAQSLFKIADASARELRECPGLIQLEKLNVGRTTVGRMGKFKTVTDEIVGRFAKNAEGLKMLDVSGCLDITVKGLAALPAKAIEKLYMSQCKAASQHEFLSVLLNWSHSLKELDLSGNSMEPAHLKEILVTCNNLVYIDVNGCRGLPWAMRKGYSGSGLKDLMSALNTLIKETPVAK